MTETTAPDDDWMTAPAPPPRSLDPAMTRPEATPQPEARPKGKVTPLRPLEALAADNDTGEQARAQLDHAIRAHQAKGREVRVWRSKIPGEDLNDALKRASQAQKESAA